MKYLLLILTLLSCGREKRDERPSTVIHETTVIEGTPGKDGAACTVEDTDTGATITCPDGSSADLLNGATGPQGEQGAAGEDAVLPNSTIVAIIDPCGPQGAYDEVVLRLADGTLIAHYSHGNKQHFAILKPGSYRTTQGGDECSFTVDADLILTDELGGVWTKS
jgi:hypothetical protein